MRRAAKISGTLDRYRNITQDAEGNYHGEQTLGDGWIAFSGRPDLMKIRVAFHHGPARVWRQIWALSDGYGEPGYIPPQGYDWSGIRDSSPEAIKEMAMVAERWWGERLWPWQEAMKEASHGEA